MSDNSNSVSGFLDKKNLASKIKIICVFTLYTIIIFVTGNVYNYLTDKKNYPGVRIDFINFLFGFLCLFSLYIILALIVVIIEFCQIIYKLILSLYYYCKKEDELTPI